MSQPSVHRPHAERHADLRLRVENLIVARGGRPVLQGVGFTFPAARRWSSRAAMGSANRRCCARIAGLLPRLGGVVALEGGAPEAELPQQAHYLAHADGLKAALTVEENLDFWSRYLGHAGEGAQPFAR